MKVNEEYSDSRSNCSNSTSTLNVEIWDENKLEGRKIKEMMYLLQ